MRVRFHLKWKKIKVEKTSKGMAIEALDGMEQILYGHQVFNSRLS
jgi:hypothetical protein